MKWYYISHPYTGNEEENRKKAADVQRHLHEMYADIMCINPLAMFAPLAALSYEKIMTYCLEALRQADAVIMCRGYEKSRGCMREYEAAKREGIPVLFYEGGDAPLVGIEEHEKGDKMQEIDMTRPQPSSEFCYLKTLDWVAELSKKTNEVVQEAGCLGGLVDDFFIETDIEDVGVTEKRLALKLTEVITFCTSWLNRIGYFENERDELQRLVNEKNKARGYF